MEFDPKATIRRPNGKRTPFTRDDINAILEHVARRAGRHLPRRRRPAASRQDPRQLPLPRHASRRSQRSRPARASARAAGAARLRRVDEPDGPQGGEHARHARRPRTATPSSSTTCRTWGRRSACATTSTNGTSAGSTSIRADTIAKRLFVVRVRAEPVADRQVRREARRSASSRAIASIRERGGRRRRPRPTWSCATTMRSGRRGGSPHSPTSMIRAIGPHGRVQRPGRREGARRHPDQAARQDPAGPI